MRVDELRALVAGKPDHVLVDLYLPGETGTLGTKTSVMPGVRGLVVEKSDGQTHVRVEVSQLRHALRLLTA